MTFSHIGMHLHQVPFGQGCSGVTNIVLARILPLRSRIKRSIHAYICPSICWSICPFLCLSTQPSIHLLVPLLSPYLHPTHSLHHFPSSHTSTSSLSQFLPSVSPSSLEMTIVPTPTPHHHQQQTTLPTHSSPTLPILNLNIGCHHPQSFFQQLNSQFLTTIRQKTAHQLWQRTLLSSCPTVNTPVSTYTEI